jgi:hypothetical protein
MAKHPEPPARLEAMHLLIRRVSRAWWRIHPKKRDAIFFGRTAENRFDAPSGEFGVLYVGGDAHAAFIETFGHETARTPFVTEEELRRRAVSIVRAKRELRLVDLRGEGLARMGADVELTGGSDYELSRRWARAIHDHRRKPDGILYRARHDPSRVNAAVFDRADGAISAKRAGTLLDAKNVGLLADILDTYGFGLVR